MTALSMVQDACAQLNLAVPTAVFGSTEQQVIQLRSLLNVEGRELSRSGQWQQITVPTTFTSVAQVVQTGAIPSDFDRFVNDSMWNQSTTRKVYGPLTQQQWQLYQAFPVMTTVNPMFIVYDDDLVFEPAPAAGNTIAYSYVSKNWAQTSGAVGIPAMTADTDTAKLPEYLITLGIVWRFLKANKFPFAAEQNDYNTQRAQELARTGGAPVLSQTYGLNQWQPYPFNVPEGNWP
jgi:hypothetical protein